MHDGRVFAAVGLARLAAAVIAVAILDDVVAVKLVGVALELLANPEALPDKGVHVVVVDVVMASKV